MQENLAIASVPVQDWGALFEAEEALRVGTVFQDLNKPFFAALDDEKDGFPNGCASAVQQDGHCDGGAFSQRNSHCDGGASPQQDSHCDGRAFSQRNSHCDGGASPQQDGHCDGGASPQQQEREQMMEKIQAVSFVLDDVRLYLDTHPDDRQGLALLKDKLAQRKTLLLAYAQQFYPLTVDCMADLYEKDPASECYCWQKGSMPWEGACV